MQKSFITMIVASAVIGLLSVNTYADSSANANNPALQAPTDSATSSSDSTKDQQQSSLDNDEATPDTPTGDDF